MMRIKWYYIARAVAVLSFVVLLGTAVDAAQQPDSSTVIRAVDAAVMARIDSIAGYTVNEHYAVYKNNDEPIQWLKMTVKTDYPRGDRQELYHPLPERSSIIRSLVLGAIPGR